MSAKHLLALGLIFALAACGTPPIAIPRPTPDAIQVYYPAALQPWADKLAGCASQIPQVALYVFPSASPAKSLAPHDIVLELGQPVNTPSSAYQAQIGWEQVVVIVNQANPVSSIATDKLRQILAGQVTQWDGSPALDIQVWVLPEGDPTRQIFDQAVKLALPLAPESWQAPDPSAMLEAVSKDKGAVGYLPESFLPSASTSSQGGVKIVQLEPSLEQALQQPVLALTLGEPAGTERELIVCAEESSSR